MPTASRAEDFELNPNGSVKKFKLRRTDLFPQSSGEFFGDIGQFLVGLKQEDWSWGIGEGYGFRH
jgi:hypothetical protein